MSPHILSRVSIDTPLGAVTVVASPAGLCALTFGAGGPSERVTTRLHRWFSSDGLHDEPNPHLDVAAEWLDAYFHGFVAETGPAPLDLRGTPFELRVWQCLLQAPPGLTFSYGRVAARLGQPHASRAVGHAVSANPVCLIVPCHRIVGANGALVGYSGGLKRKQWLLRHETEHRDVRSGRLF